MGTKICMNTSCGATATSQWKRGWKLKTGQIADLCLNCGSAYEKLAYCETFHYEETGWRECSLCNKRLHCGCSASLPFIEIQDFGGVWCINCANSAGCHLVQRDVMLSEAQTAKTCTSGDMQNPQANDKLDADSLDSRSFLCFGNFIEGRDPRYIPWPQMDDSNVSFGKLQLDVEQPVEIVGIGVANVSHSPVGTPSFLKLNEDKLNTRVKDMHEPQILPSLNMSLGTPLDSSSFGLPPPGGLEEGDKSRTPLFQPGQKPRHTLPKTPRTNLLKGSEANGSPGFQIRCARPPADGRARNQLLPRYWPRITDQELQKLSGDLNSTIVPLFEKVLSASDASRIGRLVLPKACAEAYFPSINHSEGLPLKILDVKGNEWILQFRFWPNNNSRMYVLEGVTPCIQSMQLEAGDTVTFSRIDPGGKLVMGFRKSSTSVEKKDSQSSAPHLGIPGDSSCSDVGDNQPTANLQPSTIQLIRGSKENAGNALSERSNVESGDAGWSKNGKFKGKSSEDLLQQAALSSDKKKTCNIGSKNRRLSLHSEDALELSITWDDAQDLFRPPSSIQPNILVVEEFEVEEYYEPPILGKRTLFTNRLSGGQDQWAQCDKCVKWRKLPLDVLVPPKWSCSDNIWDLTRSSCFAPEEINSKELDIFFRVGKDSKRRKVMEVSEPVQGSKPSGLDALAAAAVLGDPARNIEAPSAGGTTRHPRHRPGCTCIVCSQPPSGKGNHKPNCGCNVCSTLKRRSKTLMSRKRRRQSEREAGTEQQKDQEPKKRRQSEREPEMEQQKDKEQHHPIGESKLKNQPSPPENTSKSEEGKQQKDQEHQHPTWKSELKCQPSPSKNTSKSEEGKEQKDQERQHPTGKSELNTHASPLKNTSKSEQVFTGRATIDLNCDPTREEDVQAEIPVATGILSLVQAATVSTELQMNQSQNQNRTAYILYAEPDKPSTSTMLQPQATKKSEPVANLECELKPELEPEAVNEHGNEHQVNAAEEQGRV